MSTPFNQPNLSNFIREGSDAVLNNITFSDGTELLSAQQIATNASNINFNLAANKFLQMKTADTFATSTDGLVVASGTPPVSNPTGTNGLLSDMEVGITLLSATSKIIIDVCVFGEWNQNPLNKAIVLRRAHTQASGGSGTTKTIYGASEASLGSNRTPTLGAIVGSLSTSNNTMDGFIFRYVDSFDFSTSPSRSVGDTLTYTPVLIQGDSGDATFFQNRVISNTDARNRERGISTITLSEVLVG